ncbi:MAG: glutamate--tRNA ligase family protein, partial [Burkholderiales bacterium]|nr:glutamate--tRNA ligase family protein [Burkholderiales bacterium]
GADRIAVDATPIVFDDLDLGPVAQDLSQAVGDFVLRRADGVFAYHLACVVDDAEAGFTDVVRGADLAASTPRQIALQRLLRLPTPRYRHLPVVLDADGAKLSKQTRAAPVDLRAPAATLVRALTFLGVGPDAPIAADTPPTHVLADAVPRWRHRVAPHAAA